jgi:hypothetical protein
MAAAEVRKRKEAEQRRDHRVSVGREPGKGDRLLFVRSCRSALRPDRGLRARELRSEGPPQGSATWRLPIGDRAQLREIRI